jgi:hypothetical protein
LKFVFLLTGSKAHEEMGLSSNSNDMVVKPTLPTTFSA